MSQIEKMSQRISEIPDFQRFRQVSCVEERQEFAIVGDYKGQSYIVQDITENNFVILANGKEIMLERDDTKILSLYNNKKILFIPVDGKNGLLAFSDSFCDAVLFDEQDFCFIEFKLNATSPKKVVKNRVKAIEQLSNTINFFDEKLNRNYENLHLEAYVCTPPTYPRQDASWKHLSVEFLEKYGIDIFETTEKICR